MKKCGCFICFVFILFLIQYSLYAQNLIQDTLLISFDKPENAGTGARIDTVLDSRDTHPRLLAEYEHTKYMFVPVDLLILSKNPLNEEIQNAVQGPGSPGQGTGYKLVLDEFELTKRGVSLFYPHYQLYASVHIYESSGQADSNYIGQLLYEEKIHKPFFGDKLENGFKSVSSEWLKDMRADLGSLSSAENMSINSLQNFRAQKYYGRSVNMLSGIDIHGGTRDWLLDGEILFSSREAYKSYYRDGYNIRYRNSRKYESIELGLSGDYLFYRLDRNFLFRAKSQLMLGFNSWNDLDTAKHKLWDAFIADYSLSQSIIYNPLDKSSLVFGLGISQDVYYIYSKKINFQLSFLLNLGLKL